MEKKFMTGSFFFFRNMPGYKLHDVDYIVISDDMFEDFHRIFMIENGMGNDYYYLKKNTPEWYVQNLLSENAFALKVASALIPAVAKELGITIKMLKKLKPVANKLKHEFDGKYAYYSIILEAYLENDDFVLTNEQRAKAYESYRSSRNL